MGARLSSGRGTRRGAAVVGVVVAVAASVGAMPTPTSAGTTSACSPTAYVTNQGSDSVSTIDTATRTLTGPDITVADGPSGVAITPCAVLDAGLRGDGRTVEVTGAQFAPTSTITISIASTPRTLGTVTTTSAGTFTQSFEVP